MMRVVRKIEFAALAMAFLLIGCSRGPTNFNVDEMKIDSDLHLIQLDTARFAPRVRVLISFSSIPQQD
jgi:hypothetical protein